MTHRPHQHRRRVAHDGTQPGATTPTPRNHPLTSQNDFAGTLPKHGPWLNIAEIELSALTRQCLAQPAPEPAGQGVDMLSALGAAVLGVNGLGGEEVVFGHQQS
jgi:hypothetical protein